MNTSARPASRRSGAFAAATALIIALTSGCVSTTYETAPAARGAQGPSIVRLGPDGSLHAFGRQFPTAKALARELERHGAGASNRSGPDPVVLRCDDDTSLDAARDARDALVRHGIPSVTIQGPRTVTARVVE